MPNIYATPTEIKAAAPDAIQAGVTKYDALLLRLATTISRQIDTLTGKHFYPTYGAKILTPETESFRLRIPEMLSLTSAEYSTDGTNYTSISTSYIVAEVEQDRNGGGSYTHLRLAWNSTPIAAWPTIQDGVRLTGVWASSADRDAAWEQAGTITSSASSSVTTLTMARVSDRWNRYGFGAVYQVGNLIKIGSEFMEVIAESESAGTEVLTVVRGVNGTTASAHADNAQVYVWRPTEEIREVVIIESVKLLERGLQGFANARATADLGQLIWEKKFDVQSKMLLEPYMEF